MAPDERPIGAYYTVRRWRPDVAELDMLFVLHGDEDTGRPDRRRRGPPGARPGDPVALWGPRAAFEPPHGHGLVPARRRRHGPAGRGGDHRVAAGGHTDPCGRRGRVGAGPPAAHPSPTVSTCIGATDEADRPARPACSSTPSGRCRGSPATRTPGVAPRAAASRRCARYVRTERGLPRDRRVDDRLLAPRRPP